MEDLNLSKQLEEFLRVSKMPFLIKSVERILDRRYFVEDPSVHDCFELLCMLNGKAEFEFTDNKITASKGDFLIIKPNVAHRVSVSSESACQIFVLKFVFLGNNEVSEVSLNAFSGYISNAESGSFILLKNHCKEEIFSALTNIFNEDRISDEASDFLKSIYTIELFVWLTRALKRMWEEKLRLRGSRMENMIESAKKYIEDNYQQDIGLNDIAGYIYLSPAHFSRAFKQIINISPIQYLLMCRIKKAKELLCHTDMKISDIAFKVGFLNPQRFNEMFKKHERVSPGAFRMAFKAERVNK